MLADFGRLIILILLLPLFLILLGPGLALAALRKRQPLGPIIFDTSEYGFAARAGVLILGLILWGIVWGGLAWLTYNALSLPLPLSSMPPTPAVLQPAVSPSPPASPTVVFTATPMPAPSPTTRPAKIVPSSSPTVATPIATPTATSSSTAIPTAALTINQTPTATTAGAAPLPAALPSSKLTATDRQAVVAAVKEANRLLQEAIRQADEEHLQNMEQVWRDVALILAQSFAARIHEAYAKPIQVKFEYLQPPQIDPRSTPERVIVTTRERWRYGGPFRLLTEETFDFIYTLRQDDGRWVITRYTYRNLLATTTPAPTLTALPTPTLTATAASNVTE